MRAVVEGSWQSAKSYLAPIGRPQFLTARVICRTGGQKCRRADIHGYRFFSRKMFWNHCAIFAAVVSILALHLSAFCVVQLSA